MEDDSRPMIMEKFQRNRFYALGIGYDFYGVSIVRTFRRGFFSSEQTTRKITKYVIVKFLNLKNLTLRFVTN